MRQKGFTPILIAIILVLIGVISAYYFGTKNKSVPTPVASIQPSLSPVTTADPTANWKTYTNEEYGFEFKYPENKDNKANPIKGAPSGCQKLDSTGCVNPESYDFGVLKSCSNFDCENLIDVLVYLDPNNKYFIRDMTDMTGANSFSTITDSSLGGLAAKLRVYQNPNTLYGQMYYVTGSKYSYVIYGSPTDPISNQILSTFKFIQ